MVLFLQLNELFINRGLLFQLVGGIFKVYRMVVSNRCGAEWENQHKDESEEVKVPCRPTPEHLRLTKCEQDVCLFSWVAAHSSVSTLQIIHPPVHHLLGNSVTNRWEGR